MFFKAVSDGQPSWQTHKHASIVHQNEITTSSAVHLLQPVDRMGKQHRNGERDSYVHGTAQLATTSSMLIDAGKTRGEQDKNASSHRHCPDV